MKTAQKKFPSEIFGVHWRSKSAAGAAMRDAEICRFAGGQCDKHGHVFNSSLAPVRRELMAQPSRFGRSGCWRTEFAIRAVAELHFGTAQNVVACPEIAVRGVGNLDFVHGAARAGGEDEL